MQSPTGALAVVLNPTAGSRSGTETIQLVRALRPDAHLLIARRAGEVQRLTAAALEEGCSVIAAGGGDGTIRTVAQELVGKPATLAVLPLGTRNHFAQVLGIPLDIESAFRLLIAGEVRALDVGAVNGHTFLLYAALGLYPNFVRERERYETRENRHARWAFIRALWATLRRYPMLHVSVTAGEQCIERESPFVFTTNNISMREHLPLGVLTRPEMGKLGIYMAHRMGRLRLLATLVRLWLRRLREPGDLQSSSADRVVIETRRRRIWVATDGEVTRMDTPLRVEICRQSLNVLVPSDPGVTPDRAASPD